MTFFDFNYHVPRYLSELMLSLCCQTNTVLILNIRTEAEIEDSAEENLQ